MPNRARDAPRWMQALVAVARALATPLLEKNIVKTIALDAPVIFSMSRVVVLAFAVGMLRQLWHAGVAGWPEATLAIVVVLALPILGALERVAPEQVVELTRALVGRIGVGGVRSQANVYSPASFASDTCEPLRSDDHRHD